MKSRAFAVWVAMLVNVSFAMSTMAQEMPQASTPPATSSSSASTAPATTSDQTASTPDQAQPATAPKETHNKNKNDIDDIGNRNIGNRGIGDWYSLDTDIKMGKQYAMMVEQNAKLIQDPVITEYVNRIGQNLVRNSDSKVPFTIKVIDSDEINAFALPGGFFYVNSGLILAADEEAELAGVMAHEIAHVCARHATREMTRENYAQIATTPLMFVITSWGMYEAVNIGLGLAMPMAFMKFSRNFESEADYLGLQYMYKAGYDPQAFVSFFEKIQAREKQKPGTLSKAFASHPPTPDRIAKSESEIKELLPGRSQYIVDTSEFDSVKARLAAFEDRKKAIAPSDKDKPTLRQTKTADASTSPQNPNDDHPTLSKRDDD
ncbi:MAG: M48 family metallopeptidase [Candidatus Korobacteraceae bacterium]